MQGHVQVQLGLLVHALEVNVQHELLEGVELHVTQHNLADLTGDVHFQHAGVERFLLQGVPQVVVVDFNGQRFNCTTVDDTGGLARITQTAARTRTLLGALCSDEVHS
ncbi:hypothetical protein D3C71_1861640 [compost metagenome]